MSDLDRRVRALEETTNGLASDLEMVKSDHEKVLLDYSEAFKRLADKMSIAIDYQRATLELTAKSLPIKDVMKLFAFFAVLVLGILGAVFGIKWMALDLVR